MADDDAPQTDLAPAPDKAASGERSLAQYPAVTDTLHNLVIGLTAALALKGLVNADTAQAVGGLVAFIATSALSSIHVHGIWAKMLDSIEAHRHHS